MIKNIISLLKMVIFTNLQTVFHYHFGYDFGQPKIIAPVISSLMFTTEDVESDTLWLWLTFRHG